MYVLTIITYFISCDVVVELGLSSMELDSRLVEIVLCCKELTVAEWKLHFGPLSRIFALV